MSETLRAQIRQAVIDRSVSGWFTPSDLADAALDATLAAVEAFIAREQQFTPPSERGTRGAALRRVADWCRQQREEA